MGSAQGGGMEVDGCVRVEKNGRWKERRGESYKNFIKNKSPVKLGGLTVCWSYLVVRFWSVQNFR